MGFCWLLLRVVNRNADDPDYLFGNKSMLLTASVNIETCCPTLHNYSENQTSKPKVRVNTGNLNA